MAEPGTLPRLLLRNARDLRERPAMREKDRGIWQTFTWGQYCEHVRDFALGLAALGFDKVRLADEAKRLTGEHHASDDDRQRVSLVFVFTRFFRRFGQNVVTGIGTGVDNPTFLGVGIIIPASVHIHQMHPPGAVSILVQVVNGQELVGFVLHGSI